MKKGGGSESTIIIGPSKSVQVYTLHSLEYVLGLARFRVFVPNYILYIWAGGIIGPFFFKDASNRNVTVNGHRYHLFFTQNSRA